MTLGSNRNRARMAVCAIGGLWWAAFASAASFTVEGNVHAVSGEAIVGAEVRVDGGAAVVSDGRGNFRAPVAAGDHRLRASAIGYRPAERRLSVNSDVAGVDFVLEPSTRVAEEVVVRAIRADETAPVTRTELPRAEIQRLDYGQEMPFLLEQSPSITHYSENGSESGYSYFYLRGIHQTRVNMTFDGVPLNDPEESAVYFANFGDFASSLGSVQVQRGVGTSTVGAASYGGSVNFTSMDLTETPQAKVELGAGSFGAQREAVEAQSGRLSNGLQLFGRATYQDTDGYRDHSGVDERSGYFAAAWQGERSAWRLSGFSGQERTQLSFLATEKSVLESDPRFNEMQPEERDHYWQDLVQLQYSRLLGSTASLAVQVYYNGAGGWFKLWDDEVAKTALQRFATDGATVGSLVTLNAKRGNWNLESGLHLNHFERDHSLSVAGDQLYFNQSRKDEVNGFLKLGWDRDRTHLYADAQVRRTDFRYRGDVAIKPVDWTFFNPKLGARYDLRPGLSAYASVGQATREPTRTDLLQGEDNASVAYDLRAVKPERVTDWELGSDWRTAGTTLHANLYAMEFRHEIAATGELSEIGNLLRRNVDRSYRRGLEVDLLVHPRADLRVATTVNLSRNRIEEWTQFYDLYDPEGNLIGSISRRLHDVEPLLTPPVVLSQSVDWTGAAGLSVGLAGRYVARSYLDNTDAPGLTTPAAFDLQASAALELSRWVKTGSPRLRLRVTNLLDNHRLWPSGYSYLFANRDEAGHETLDGTAYYYPLATRAYSANVDFHF